MLIFLTFGSLKYTAGFLGFCEKYDYHKNIILALIQIPSFLNQTFEQRRLILILSYVNFDDLKSNILKKLFLIFHKIIIF